MILVPHRLVDLFATKFFWKNKSKYIQSIPEVHDTVQVPNKYFSC